MKALPLLALLLLALAPVSPAQDKPRKSMSFPPGSSPPVATPIPDQAPSKEIDRMALGNDEPARLAAAFFGLLEKNQIDEAYANLTKGSKISERPEELRTLKAKTTEAMLIFGAIHGFELIDDKPVGTKLMRRTYISLGRDFPLRWRFYFYQSEKQWRLVDLRVDDRLGGIFDEPEEPRPPESKP